MENNVYIPSKLDIEQLVNEYPPLEIQTFCSDKLKYILSLIYSIPYYNKKNQNENGFTPINAAILSNSIRDYKQYFKYLIRTGVLESDNHYIPGSKSIGFRFSEKYLSILKPVTITRFTLLKHIQNYNKLQSKNAESLNYLKKWFNPGLLIDKSAAYDYLAVVYRENAKENKKSPLLYSSRGFIRIIDNN